MASELNILYPIMRDNLKDYMIKSYEDGRETYTLKVNNKLKGVSGYVSIVFASSDSELPNIITMSCSNGNSVTIQRDDSMNMIDLMLAMNTVFRRELKDMTPFMVFVNSFELQIALKVYRGKKQFGKTTVKR